MKNKYTKKSTYVNGMKGKTQSLSARKKIGIAAKNSMTGKKFTKEHKLNIGLALSKGKNLSKSIRTVVKRDNNKCRICETSENLTINHKIPSSAGGSSRIDNLEILCFKCNIKEYHRIVKIALKFYFESLKIGN